MDDRAALALSAIVKRFGPLTAVDGVDLHVPVGGFFALLGPSGCGKTTLMRIAAGLEQPDSGKVLIDGVDMTGRPAHERPVNLMFQSYALFPHLSVADNIAYGLRRAGASRAQIAARVAEMARLAQLQGLEARKPHQLSGGQRQRVALARALARGPKLLLLDEPLGALDRQLREETQFELMQLQRRLGVAFLVVTHDQDEALSMADRVAVMRAGRIEQIGAPADVYTRPRSRFVARFIGDSNILEGQAGACVDGLIAVETADGIVRVRLAGAAPARGDKVAVALKPEHVRLCSPESAVLTGLAQETTFRGDHRLARVALGSGALVKVAIEASAAPVLGEKIGLSFAPADAVLLHA
jgi:putrescine transport system ATP-binding protein